MKENVDYEVTFPNGDVTTLRLLETRSGAISSGDDCLMQYLDGENRKPVTPKNNNSFWFPKNYVSLCKIVEL